ncbi:MAG: AIR synthase-related protein, partial [Armatimonadota bacterium]|nr:AIR synthase-related protein [Armatimonadota bacterium]MDW8143548.1 AIR synthase-related protein [Armatimonadota bacterium]
KITVGQNLQKGDVVVGLASNGIHSNGLTLARRIFFDIAKWSPSQFVPEFGCAVGEELLKPTRIYVKPVLELMKQISVKALVHITGGGFLNLLRVQTPCEFVIESLPETPPIFTAIQKLGQVPDEEMFTTFNMGIGFCVVVAPEDADKTVAILQSQGERAQIIGHISGVGERKVRFTRQDLTFLPSG